MIDTPSYASTGVKCGLILTVNSICNVAYTFGCVLFHHEDEELQFGLKGGIAFFAFGIFNGGPFLNIKKWVVLCFSIQSNSFLML